MSGAHESVIIAPGLPQDRWPGSMNFIDVLRRSRDSTVLDNRTRGKNLPRRGSHHSVPKNNPDPQGLRGMVSMLRSSWDASLPLTVIPLLYTNEIRKPDV